MAEDWYPGAVARRITEDGTQARTRPTQIILHSAAGRGSLFNFWQNGSSLESHGWVGFDGTFEQYLRCTVKADANLTANRRPDGTGAISVESESSITATEPWTPEQVEAIVGFCVWACRTYGIPARQCPAHDAPGIGWHVMFGAPGPWAPNPKSCPGGARIAQVPGIIAEVARRLAGKSTPTPDPAPKDWFDMATKEELAAVVNDLLVVHLRDLKADQKAEHDWTAGLFRRLEAGLTSLGGKVPPRDPGV